ncbi:MAG: BhlA/UviB family holin-like peptide [Cetobacterium sp.]|nr:BhlA/UviB family holin-like peptide [Cetobacterium sp.]
MEQNLIEMATTQGVWAILSIFLIIYILRRQEKRDKINQERERHYQDVIKRLQEQLSSK